MTAPQTRACLAAALGIALTCSGAQAADDEVPTSYSPVVITEKFETIMQRMVADKDGILKRHRELLEQRYDLSDKPAEGLQMTRGKPIQAGVRVKLPDGTSGMSWPI